MYVYICIYIVAGVYCSFSVLFIVTTLHPGPEWRIFRVTRASGSRLYECFKSQ